MPNLRDGMPSRELDTPMKKVNKQCIMAICIYEYRSASNNFVHPLDPALIQASALIFFIRYFDPALFFLLLH